MGTAVGIVGTIFDSAVDFFSRDDVRVFITLFLTTLWTTIGLLWLRDRLKPRVTTPYHDYRWALIFEGLKPAWDRLISGRLNFVLQIRNFGSGPLKYKVEQFDVQIGSRTPPKRKKGELVGFLQRGAGKMLGTNSFNKDEIGDFYCNPPCNGTADIIIIYGEPDKEPERRFSLSLDLALGINEIEEGKPPVILWQCDIREERDEPIK